MKKLLTAFSAATLAACGGEATVTDGLQSVIEARNMKTEANASVPEAEAGQTFYTTDGRNKRVDLENGMIVLFPVAVNRCESAAVALGRQLLDAVLPAALAHGNHLDAPGGVIDVTAADGTVWALGSVPVSTGEYCSVDLALARLPQEAPGADTGAILYIAPCWYPDSGSIPDLPGLPVQPDEVNHTCFQQPIAAPHHLDPITLDFGHPMQLDASKRTARVHLRIEYDTWFNEVDAADLTSEDVAAREAAEARLIENVLASVRLDEIHLGP